MQLHHKRTRMQGKKEKERHLSRKVFTIGEIMAIFSCRILAKLIERAAETYNNP